MVVAFSMTFIFWELTNSYFSEGLNHQPAMVCGRYAVSVWFDDEFRTQLEDSAPLSVAGPDVAADAGTSGGSECGGRKNPWIYPPSTDGSLK